MTFQKMLDLAVNKFHVILGSVAQAALIVYHFKTGKDVGPGLMSTVYAYYAFLLGHAGVYQKWPDSENGDANSPSGSAQDAQPAPAKTASTGSSGAKG